MADSSVLVVEIRRGTSSRVAPDGGVERPAHQLSPPAIARPHPLAPCVAGCWGVDQRCIHRGRHGGGRIVVARAMAVKKTKRRYQVQWYDADGRLRKRTFRGITRDEAIREERKLLSERDRGEPTIDRRLAPTVSAFATTWVEEHRSGWRDSTREQYEHVIARWIRPTFGTVRVSDLSEARVRQFIAKLQDAGLFAPTDQLHRSRPPNDSPDCLRRRLLRDDPFTGVRPLREARSEVDPLDPDEVATFLAACPGYWRQYFAVAFWTGARPGELLHSSEAT